MHFHLPKPLHGWRAFVGEVGIIVIGVLIALGAEQVVEEFHWREKVAAAEAAMRLELAEDDGPQAYARTIIGACLNQQLIRIRDGAGGSPPDQLRQWIANYSPPSRNWDSEAWKVVVASDVASHMGADRLVGWSSPYRPMPMLSENNNRETQLATELRNGLPVSGDLSSEDVRMVRRTVGQLMMLNRRLLRGSQLVLARSQRNGATVAPIIQKELLTQARAIYGACAKPPSLSAPPEAQGLAADLHGGSLGTD